MKTKILICGILPPPNFGHSMIYQALMQSAFVAEFDVTFFNMKFWSYEKHKKVTAEKLLKFGQYYLQFIWLLISRRPKYVLYAISFDKMPFVKDFVFCMTGRLLGAKIVLHDMGQYLRELRDSLSPFQQKMLRLMMRRVTASIVLGEVTRQLYRDFMFVDRVFAVPGAVADSAQMATAPVLKKGGDARLEVLFFSFLQPSKGVWTALKAIPRVVKENPRVHFTFVGPVSSPQLLAEIDQYIADQNLAPYFTCAGYVEDEQRRTQYFRQSDIFIFPTLRDVFGLVLLHAMAESLPVIASREGAIPEIVEEGKSGLLFAKNDDAALAQNILSLARDPQARANMGRRGRERFERHYTFEVYGQRMIKVFKTLDAGC